VNPQSGIYGTDMVNTFCRRLNEKKENVIFNMYLFNKIAFCFLAYLQTILSAPAFWLSDVD
jgi:hypothetical protein